MRETVKILLFENHAPDTGKMEQFLSQQSWISNYTVVDNEQSFTKALVSFTPDVVLFSLPGEEPQFETALSIARKCDPGIPFIILAISESVELAQKVMRSEANDYIMKDNLTRLPSAITTARQLYLMEKEKLAMAQAMNISKRNYETIFLKGPLPKWIYDYETLAFLEVNEAAMAKYGYTRAEFMKMTLRDIRPKDELPLLMEYFKNNPKGSRKGHWHHLKKNGEIITVETTAHSITFNNRKARLVTINDVTESEIAGQKIERIETNLKILFDHASEGFLLLDDTACILAFNNKAEEHSLVNISKKMELGHSIYEFVEDSRKAYFQKVMERVLSGETIQYDRSFVKKKKTIWLEFSIVPVFIRDQIKYVCITGRDITEKKAIEEEREFDRNNLKALINNTKDLMWSLDRNYNLITYNEALEKAVTIAGGHIDKENNLIQGFNGERHQLFMSYYARAFTGETFMITEYHHIPENYWADITFYPIFNLKEVVGVACFSRDVSWRIQAEEDRKNYIHSLEEMLFKISHKLRVPISNLLGLGNIVDSPATTTEDLVTIMGFIKPTVTYLDDFSKELTRFIESMLKDKNSTVQHNTGQPNDKKS